MLNALMRQTGLALQVVWMVLLFILASHSHADPWFDRQLEGLRLLGVHATEWFHLRPTGAPPDPLPAAVQGNYLYVTGRRDRGGQGSLLTIYDISNPQQPVRLGGVLGSETGRFGKQVVVQGNYAYVGCAGNSYYEDGGWTYVSPAVAIVDVSDPASPREVGEYPVNDFYSIFVNGNFLYVFHRDTCEVVDVREPSNPRRVGEISITPLQYLINQVDEGVRIGNALFLTRHKYIVAIDISDPSHPRQIGEYRPPDDDYEIENNTLAAYGNYLFVGVLAKRVAEYSEPAILILDVSRPDAIQLASSIVYADEPGSFVLESYDVVGDALVVSISGRLLVYDLSQPSSPALMGEIRKPGSERWGMVKSVPSRKLLLDVLVDPTHKMAVWDFENPASPRLLSVVDSSLFVSKGMVARNGHILLKDPEGTLKVVDARDPNHLRVVSRPPTPPDPANEWYLHRLRSDLAGLFKDVDTVSNLIFLDISNLPEVRQRGSYPVSRVHSVYENRLLTVVPDSQWGWRRFLEVVDITDLDTPVLLSRVPLEPLGIQGNIDAMAAGANTAYLVEGGTLHVLDISDPTQPIPLGRLEDSSFWGTKSMELAGSLLVVSGSQGLSVIDVSNPSQPMLLNRWVADVFGFTLRLQRAGNLVLWAVQDKYSPERDEVYIFDLNRLPDWTPVARVKRSTTGLNIATAERGTIYLAGPETSIHIARLRNESPAFAVFGATPSNVPAQQGITLRVSGIGFQQGASFRLERGSDIVEASAVQVVSEEQIQGVVNLENKPLWSVWDVVVRNADGLEVRKRRAVTIRPPSTRWVNPSGGRWSDASNWDNGLPNENLPAVIDLPGNYVVSLDTSTSIAQLVLGAAFGEGKQVLEVPEGVTLTVWGGGLIRERGDLRLSGTFTGGGDLQVWGRLQWYGGSIARSTETARLLVHPSGVLDLSRGAVWATYQISRPIENRGTISLREASVTMQGAVSIVNFGNMEAIEESSFALAGGGSATLRNAGTMVVQSPLTLSGITLRNEGMLRLSGGELRVAEFVQTDTGAVDFGIGGTEPGQFGRLIVAQELWLGGTLSSSWMGNFSPRDGMQFAVVQGAGRQGDFRTTSLPRGVAAEWDSNRTLLLKVTQVVLGVERLQPEAVAKRDGVQIELFGTGLDAVTSVQLCRQEGVIEASRVEAMSAVQARAEFNLASVSEGEYDLVVRDSSGQEVVRSSAVKVYDPQRLQVVDVEPYALVLTPESVVTFRVQGSQFDANCEVTLKRPVPEEAPINARSVQVENDSTLQATFDLRGAKIGPYDLVVRKGEQTATYRMHLFARLPVMYDRLINPPSVLVGRVTTWRLEVYNLGNEATMAVYGAILPQGFELVGVDVPAGGEWGQTADGSLVIALPVQPGEMQQVQIRARVGWDKVSIQPEPGKYRLGDRVRVITVLLGSPLLEHWTAVRAGATWDELPTRAMVGYGTVRNLYLEDLEPLTMEEISAHLMATAVEHPIVAQVLGTAIQTGVVMTALGDEFHKDEGTGRASSRSFLGFTSWKDFADTMALTAVYSLQDVTRPDPRDWVVRTIALGEGFLEGVTFGLVRVNLSERLARCVGIEDTTVVEGGRIAGNIASFAVPSGIFVKAGKGLLKLLPALGDISQDLRVGFRALKPKEGYWERVLLSVQDGTPALRGLGKNIVYATRGNVAEPKRIIGYDKWVPMQMGVPIPTGIPGVVYLARPTVFARANIFHIGYHAQHGWHVGIGYVNTLLKPGQIFPPAGWHFYGRHAFHPRFGEIRYMDLVQTGVASSAAAGQVGLYGLVQSAESSLSEVCGGSTISQLVAAYDPNNIVVSPDQPYLSSEQTMNFTINFENLAQANYPAEDVNIRLVLPEALDIDSVQFGASSHPQLLATAIDRETRTIRWRFTGINLPPNRTPPEGEGWVQFSVNWKQGLPSGTKARVYATIVFDENPPIDTNLLDLTLDTQPPQTQFVNVPSEARKGLVDLEWRAEDDLSGVAHTTLWLHEERVDGTPGRHSASGDRTRQVELDGRTYTPIHFASADSTPHLPLRIKYGYVYRLIATSRDNVGNEEEPRQPLATLQLAAAPQVGSGLRLVSVPVQSEEVDPKAVFGFSENFWATWDPSANEGRGAYVFYPDAAVQFGENTPVIGRAYWTKLSQAVIPRLFGDVLTGDQPFRIALRAGWNLIGNPWLADLEWNPTAIQVLVGDQTKPLSEAEGVVEPYAWRWDGNAYRLVYSAGTPLPNVDEALPAWSGAWVFAYQPCELILPVPESIGAQITRKGSSVPAGAWSITLRARANDTTGEAIIGSLPGGRGLSVGAPPLPPGAQEGVQVVVVRNGQPLAADLRNASRAGGDTWDIEVRVPAGESERATLWWQDVHRAPRGVNPVLVDLQTGERRFLRHTSSHTFAISRQGGVYKFRVELLPTGSLLRITGVRVSGGRSQGSYTLSFNVNTEAQVEVTVLSAGKVVRKLMQTVTRSAGIQQVSWDGRDDKGIALPAGAYMVEVKATGTDGQVARVAVPIVLTR